MNDAYLDGRINTVATAAATADTKATNAGAAAAAAVPKSGGEAGAMTGTLVMRGGGTAVRRANFFHNANATNDFGAKLTLSYTLYDQGKQPEVTQQDAQKDTTIINNG